MPDADSLLVRWQKWQESCVIACGAIVILAALECNRTVAKCRGRIVLSYVKRIGFQWDATLVGREGPSI
ncbi:hypothetical protein GWI33_012126, partial [Rhynchophorus ferrugineus]